MNPDEETVFVRTAIPRSMLVRIDEFTKRLVQERNGPVTRAQALRELLGAALDDEGLVEGKKR